MGQEFVKKNGMFFRRWVTQSSDGRALELYAPVPIEEVIRAGYDPARIEEVSWDPEDPRELY